MPTTYISLSQISCCVPTSAHWPGIMSGARLVRYNGLSWLWFIAWTSSLRDSGVSGHQIWRQLGSLKLLPADHSVKSTAWCRRAHSIAEAVQAGPLLYEVLCLKEEWWKLLIKKMMFTPRGKSTLRPWVVTTAQQQSPLLNRRGWFSMIFHQRLQEISSEATTYLAKECAEFG